MKGVLRGLWHAHIGWFFDEEQTSAKRWAPDLVKDPAMRKIDSLFPLWVLISFAAAPLIAFGVTASLSAALTAFLWASLVRIFLLHHVTWSVNSICHFYGRRPYETTDHSTNNWMLSLLSFGESWHNNHHAFPTSAFHGLRRFEVDPGGWVIWTLEKLGLAWKVVRIPPERQSAKLASR